MDQYYCLTQNPEYPQILQFILACNLKHSVYLDRTAFWVPHGPINVQFQQRFADTCPAVPADHTHFE